MNKKISYAAFISAALLTGIISALLTMKNMNIYDLVTTPPLSPPSLLFPIVWTILYVLMGVSATRIYISNRYQWNSSLTIWALQLVINFFWSIIFFNYKAFLFSFIWLLLLLITITVMIFLFYKKDKTAAYIQVPYFLWVTFAGYLNFSIYLLN